MRAGSEGDGNEARDQEMYWFLRDRINWMQVNEVGVLSKFICFVLAALIMVQGLYYWGEPDEPFNQRFMSDYIYEMGQNIGFGWVFVFHLAAACLLVFLGIKEKGGKQ